VELKLKGLIIHGGLLYHTLGFYLYDYIQRTDFVPLAVASWIYHDIESYHSRVHCVFRTRWTAIAVNNNL
jgi:hypothetical protein